MLLWSPLLNTTPTGQLNISNHTEVCISSPIHPLQSLSLLHPGHLHLHIVFTAGQQVIPNRQTAVYKQDCLEKEQFLLLSGLGFFLMTNN